MQPSIGEVINATIATTALLANRFSVALKGEYLLPDEDYIRLVPEFQRRLSRLIMPIRTKDELVAKADEFINELLKEMKNESSGDGTGKDNGVNGGESTSGEN